MEETTKADEQHGVAPIDYSAEGVTFRVGGQDYTPVSSKLCSVCRSPYRNLIESMLAREGTSYAAAERALPPGHGLNQQSIRRHSLNGHMPFHLGMRRGIIETRAKQQGKQLAEGIESAVTELALADLVVQRTWETVARGEQIPTVAEGLTAARFVFQAEQTASESLSNDNIARAFAAFFDAARQWVPPENFDGFMKSLLGNPVVAGLLSGAPQAITSEVVDTSISEIDDADEA